MCTKYTTNVVHENNKKTLLTRLSEVKFNRSRRYWIIRANEALADGIPLSTVLSEYNRKSFGRMGTVRKIESFQIPSTMKYIFFSIAMINKRFDFWKKHQKIQNNSSKTEQDTTDQISPRLDVTNSNRYVCPTQSFFYCSLSFSNNTLFVTLLSSTIDWVLFWQSKKKRRILEMILIRIDQNFYKKIILKSITKYDKRGKPSQKSIFLEFLGR